MTDAEWLPIPGWEGLYEIARDGQIRRVGRRGGAVGRRLTPLVKYARTTRGYRQIDLYRDGVLHRALVHRLVALTFIGPCPDGHQVNHKNGNRQDNRVENLEYVTASENQSHSFRELGRQSPKGSEQWMARLTEQDIPVVRTMRGNGASLNAIATHFGVAPTTISSVLTGKSWKHV